MRESTGLIKPVSLKIIERLIEDNEFIYVRGKLITRDFESNYESAYNRSIGSTSLDKRLER